MKKAIIICAAIAAVGVAAAVYIRRELYCV